MLQKLDCRFRLDVGYSGDCKATDPHSLPLSKGEDLMRGENWRRLSGPSLFTRLISTQPTKTVTVQCLQRVRLFLEYCCKPLVLHVVIETVHRLASAYRRKFLTDFCKLCHTGPKLVVEFMGYLQEQRLTIVVHSRFYGVNQFVRNF